MKSIVTIRRILAVAVVLISVLAMPGILSAKPRACSSTAEALFLACGLEVQSDLRVAQAICTNVSDAERAQCFTDARASSRESGQLCKEQLDWRLEACEITGEDRYDPDFDPALFDDPKNPTNPNPYFPLTVGNKWEYASETETNTVEILNETKLIDGVTCIVSRDQVFDKEDGFIKEDTDDWFATAKVGDTWYCGEEVKNFETFQGDDPMIPELVGIGGSFKAGRNGDKPGIIFPASPQVGDVNREEFSLANAEDIAEVVSTTYVFGKDKELDQLVPKDLADHFCKNAGDCVVTFNRSLLDPGVIERKYYALGIGNFLEVVPDEGEVVRLVKCNVDPVLCMNVPQP